MSKVSKELIESYRKIVIPFVAKKLYNMNFEGQGALDRAEFEQDCNEILDLAISALHPTGDSISREVINSEIEKRYCSKQCVLPSEEPYCPDNCPARFLKNIVKECPSVPERPQGDLISRNDALKAVDIRHEELLHDIEYRRKHCQIDLLGIKKHILAIPSAPERPKGKWIGDCYNPECDQCHTKPLEEFCDSLGLDGGSYVSIPMFFCPNCGADMRKGEEEYE